MKAVLVTSLVILLFVFMEHTTAQRHICPPWFELDPRSNTGCSCTNADEAIVCGSDQSETSSEVQEMLPKIL